MIIYSIGLRSMPPLTLVDGRAQQCNTLEIMFHDNF
jgi:hypothetical protein